MAQLRKGMEECLDTIEKVKDVFIASNVVGNWRRINLLPSNLYTKIYKNIDISGYCKHVTIKNCSINELEFENWNHENNSENEKLPYFSNIFVTWCLNPCKRWNFSRIHSLECQRSTTSDCKEIRIGKLEHEESKLCINLLII